MTEKSSESGSALIPAKDDKSVIAQSVIEFIPVVRAYCVEKLPFFNNEDFSDNQMAWCWAFVQTGGNHQETAKLTGFSERRSQIMASGPKFSNVISALVRLRLKTEGMTAAAQALISIVRDPGAPPPARVQAARVVKEWTDEHDALHGRDPGSGKALSEMTVQELAGLVDKMNDVAKLQDKTIVIHKSGQ